MQATQFPTSVITKSEADLGINDNVLLYSPQKLHMI